MLVKTYANLWKFLKTSTLKMEIKKINWKLLLGLYCNDRQIDQTYNFC